MTIKSGELMLWSRSSGEINLVRVLRPASTGYACEVCDRHGTPVTGGSSVLAGPTQLSQAVRLSDLTHQQSKDLMAARVNVLVFDNLNTGRMICGQLVNTSAEWVNVRYKGALYNRKNHNVWLMPDQAVPANTDEIVEIVKLGASPASIPEAILLADAGRKRGFILWNPKSTHAPTVVHPTLEKAREVQRLMAVRHPNEFFHICPVGPGLAIKTVQQEQTA